MQAARPLPAGRFVKAYTLARQGSTRGERSAALARVDAMAASAGLTRLEAIARCAPPVPPEVAAANPFASLFGAPDMFASNAERDRERMEKRHDLLDVYGSEDAVFADTPMEAALRVACEPLLGKGQTWNTSYKLAGWGQLDGRQTLPEALREVVTTAWPLPMTVEGALAEWRDADTRYRERELVVQHYEQHLFLNARGYVVEDLLQNLPAERPADIRARFEWMEYALGEGHGIYDDKEILATVRADVDRLMVRLSIGEAA